MGNFLAAWIPERGMLKLPKPDHKTYCIGNYKKLLLFEVFSYANSVNDSSNC